MTASNISITAGAGTRLATNSYTEGAVTVHDEKFIPGEFPYPTYMVVPLASVSIATANDHVLQIMAGSTNRVRVRWIHIRQNANATSAPDEIFEVWRITTAGTGGTAITARPFDPADSAYGGTAMTLPSSKGTESILFDRSTLVIRQAIATTATQIDGDLYFMYDGIHNPPLIIAAGTANGIAVKSITAATTGSVAIRACITETSF